MKKSNTQAPAAKPAAMRAEAKKKVIAAMQYDYFQKIKEDFIKKLFDNYYGMFNEYQIKVFSDDNNNFKNLVTNKERDVNIKKILLTDEDNILVIKDIKNIREKSIIIDFICYSDTLLEKKLLGLTATLILSQKNIGLDKKLKKFQ
jgi:hypothetical protein